MPELRVRNCYLKPHLFATQRPEWAAAAREFVRQRPDLCLLRFSSAHVCGPASDFESVSEVTVTLTSHTRSVSILVVRAGEGFEVSIQSDQALVNGVVPCRPSATG